MNPIEDIAKMNDHDLLVTMHEQIKQVRIDIQNLREGTNEKILDHETRIRRLENWGALALGGAYVLQFIFKYVLR